MQEDTIFVSGMNPELTEEDIGEHFGAIGVIKVNINALYCKKHFFCGMHSVLGFYTNTYSSSILNIRYSKRRFLFLVYSQLIVNWLIISATLQNSHRLCLEHFHNRFPF